MKFKKNPSSVLVLLAGALLAFPLVTQAAGNIPTAKPSSLSDQVGHQLRMLPYYGIFDNLMYQVDGSTVTLSGQVVRPVLKSDAGNVVKTIPGVSRVVNDIQVLPNSPFDDSIRLRELRAIFSNPSLQRYAMGAQPSIRIVVDNGNVTLVGYVANSSDKDLAGMRASQVPGVFSVKNDLRIG